MVHNSRFIRSLLLTPWRKVTHFGALVVMVFCVLACSAHRIEHGPTAALMLIPLDALIHATVLQVILIMLLISAGACWALWRTLVSLRALQTVRLQPSPSLLTAASDITPLDAIYLLLDDRPFAACLGLWRPVIYITSGMLDHVNPEALRAAIAHEEMHRRRRDPLRLLAIHVLATRLRLVPWVAGLPQRVELRAEILADRFAQAQTSRAALAAAILAAVRANMQGSNPKSSGPFRVNHGIARLYGSSIEETSVSVLDVRLRYLTLPFSSPLPHLLPFQMWSVRPLSSFLSHWKVGVSLAGVLSLVIVPPSATQVGSVPAILSCPLHV